ncbi:MAG: hypothetical protein M3462_11245 [Chloroflexota bacterium]|nr:hypothetical protein [Chloroflexota bacterium]
MPGEDETNQRQDQAPGGGDGIRAPGEDDQARAVAPLDRVRARLDERIGGRPVSAYAVLVGGALVLCVLLAIILGTSGDDEPGESRTCYQQPDVQIAKDDVLDGAVERVRVIVPEGRPDFGVALLELDYVDGTCYTLPQGVIGQDNAFLILGALETYNRTTDQRRVEVTWDEDAVPTNVLFTPTPSPTTAPEPTWTLVPTWTVVPVATVGVVDAGSPAAGIGDLPLDPAGTPDG